MITVLGKLKDIEEYRDKEGYNVFSGEWNEENMKKWLNEAMERGDKFLLTSSDFTGCYLEECSYILWNINSYYTDQIPGNLGKFWRAIIHPEGMTCSDDCPHCRDERNYGNQI